MNLWQKTKRFLEPCRVYPFVTFLRFFTSGTTICFTLLLAYFLKEIVHSIELRDMETFLQIVMRASIIMVSFQIIGFFLRNYYWVEQQFVWDKYFMRKYLQQFTRLEQGTVEALGTGKILSILQKGTDESIMLLISVIGYSARIFFTLLF
jgi:ABC-type bacteriocin/lantibiotic exporter with double-glycine peptidase domain